ncbi:MAG: N-acetylmuramoyl-L-alanine amidase [Flavobacteriales bacterium]|nr:N-acetylmuramoyl-L-alanine amidase [Flavobacteriales bacterium]
MPKYNIKKYGSWLIFPVAILAAWLFSGNSVKHTIDFKEVSSTIDTQNNQAFVKVLELNLEAETFYKNIDFGFKYTSFILQFDGSKDMIDAWYRTEQKEEFKLDSIPSTDEPENVFRSPFIIPKQTQSSFNFYTGKLEGKVLLYLFYAPTLSLDISKSSKQRKTDVGCEKPDMILGKTWREGLPASTGTREKNEVHFCIVHHSAGANDNHDYLNIVRNIYLLHTQTNGWDDIGYNFLIAQDGTIFEGRESQGIDSTDNIKGAHFCGKNTGTMGICLLGNYMETSPTEATKKSLAELLAWKCFKDGITPFGSSFHESGGATLAHIAGHRDGCSTACPGDSVYQMLDSLRTQVEVKVNACNLASMSAEGIKTLKWHYKPVLDEFVFELPVNTVFAQIYDVRGSLIRSEKVLNAEIFQWKQPTIKAGYVLFTTSNGKIFSTKFLAQ